MVKRTGIPFEELSMEDGLLYIIKADSSTQIKTKQLLVPNRNKTYVIEKTHNVNHEAVNETCDQISKNFYWKGMRRDVANYIKVCPTCGKNTTKIERV